MRKALDLTATHRDHIVKNYKKFKHDHPSKYWSCLVQDLENRFSDVPKLTPGQLRNKMMATIKEVHKQ